MHLVVHPTLRFRKIRDNAPLGSRRGIPPLKLEENLVGLVYDEKEDRLHVPPHVEPSRERLLRRGLFPPTTEERGRWSAHRQLWIGRILERYRNSKTIVILMQMPRGPVVRSSLRRGENPSAVAALVKNDRTILLNPALFDSLESPEYFFDHVHMNTAGRREFTERLVEELIVRLPPER